MSDRQLNDSLHFQTKTYAMLLNRQRKSFSAFVFDQYVIIHVIIYVNKHKFFLKATIVFFSFSVEILTAGFAVFGCLGSEGSKGKLAWHRRIHGL